MVPSHDTLQYGTPFEIHRDVMWDGAILDARIALSTYRSNEHDPATCVTDATDPEM